MFPTLILCQRWGRRATGEQAVKISDYKPLSKADESSGTAESQPQHFWNTNWKVWRLNSPGPDHSFYEGPDSLFLGS